MGLDKLRKDYPVKVLDKRKELNLKGWRTWDSEFHKLLPDRNKNYVIVEVGCWFGKMTRKFLEQYPNATIIVIDTFEGGPEHQEGKEHYQKELSYLYDEFTNNIYEYKDRVIPIKAFSWDGLNILDQYNIKPDLIYIDAGHTYNAVKKDLTTAYYLFGDKSIITGDDYDSIRPNDVKKVVDEFTNEKNIRLYRHERFWSLKI